MQLTRELIHKYNIDGPRYTSYPTAPVWNNDLDASRYIKILKEATVQELSLYIHIPFCVKRCLYCACNVVIKNQQTAVADEYLDYLEQEIILVTNALPSRPLIKQIHLGGGTPTFLTIGQLTSLHKLIEKYFILQLDEYAIEIDPRSVDKAKIQHLKTLGFNRLSFGVQDFATRVQKEIRREHSFAEVLELFNISRQANFQSINLDLIYGLPYQTVETFNETLDKVSMLKPERIALYSYAYVPWIHKHQTAMNQDMTPAPAEKVSIFLQARNSFLEQGYVAIAMDHFALKDDSLAQAYGDGSMKRNFMGYTTLATDNYLGLGVSSIGYINQHFIQNIKQLDAYYSSLSENKVATARGYSLNNDDIIRQWVIMTLMCSLQLRKQDFYSKFNQVFDTYFAAELLALESLIAENFIINASDHLQVTGLGKTFVRNICMIFDSYLKSSKPSGGQQPRVFSKTI